MPSAERGVSAFPAGITGETQMTFRHMATVWTLTQGVRLAWAMARVARQLGDAGERLESGLEAVAVARGVDMLAVLEPLTAPLSVA
jgi:hypothetical protein